MNSAKSTLSPELIEAYRQTHYQVHDNPPFTLRIDEPSSALRSLFDKKRIQRCAFLTAHNPFSELTNEIQNCERQSELKALVDAQGLPYLEGIGQLPNGEWPGEPSLLILGITRENASKLAMHFGQNAFVWASSNATPSLHLLR
jgi:hypothetical protein